MRTQQKVVWNTFGTVTWLYLRSCENRREYNRKTVLLSSARAENLVEVHGNLDSWKAEGKKGKQMQEKNTDFGFSKDAGLGGR